MRSSMNNNLILGKVCYIINEFNQSALTWNIRTIGFYLTARPIGTERDVYQRWVIKRYSDTNYCYIINSDTGRAITNKPKEPNWGESFLSEFEGLDTQLYTIEEKKDGFSVIKLINSDNHLLMFHPNGRVYFGPEKHPECTECWRFLYDIDETTSAESDTGSDGSDTDPDGSDTDPDGSDTDPDGSDTDPDGSDTDPDGSETGSDESNELANSQAQVENASQILYTAPANMIKEVCKAIADAQRELDAQALEAQRTLEEKHKDLFDIGYRVTWYQIPELTMELKVAVSFEQSAEGSKLYFTPYNAAYKSAYNYQAEGTSNIKMRVTPVPPPIGSDENRQG
jgi:hypothetical protein